MAIPHRHCEKKDFFMAGSAGLVSSIFFESPVLPIQSPGSSGIVGHAEKLPSSPVSSDAAEAWFWVNGSRPVAKGVRSCYAKHRFQPVPRWMTCPPLGRLLRLAAMEYLTREES